MDRLKADPKFKNRTIEEKTLYVREIQFAYNNHSLINLLKLRGTAITNLDFDGIRDCDKEINKEVKDPTKYESLTRPVCAFITFQSDDG